MAVKLVEQKSVLNIDEQGNKSSPKVWFDGDIQVNGLDLTLPATTFYYQGNKINTNSVIATITADTDYDKHLFIYVDHTDIDGWIVDEVLQDGLHEPTEVPMLEPNSPISGKVAWGKISAGGTEIELTVLRHMEGR